MWGLIEKEDQIKKSVKLKQKGAEYIFDTESGTKKRKVLKERGCAGNCLNIMILLLFAGLAIIGLVITNYASKAFEFKEEEKRK